MYNPAVKVILVFCLGAVVVCATPRSVACTPNSPACSARGVVHSCLMTERTDETHDHAIGPAGGRFETEGQTKSCWTSSRVCSCHYSYGFRIQKVHTLILNRNVSSRPSCTQTCCGVWLYLTEVTQVTHTQATESFAGAWQITSLKLCTHNVHPHWPCAWGRGFVIPADT